MKDRKNEPFLKHPWTFGRATLHLLDGFQILLPGALIFFLKAPLAWPIQDPEVRPQEIEIAPEEMLFKSTPTPLPEESSSLPPSSDAPNQEAPKQRSEMDLTPTPQNSSFPEEKNFHPLSLSGGILAGSIRSALNSSDSGAILLLRMTGPDQPWSLGFGISSNSILLVDISRSYPGGRGPGVLNHWYWGASLPIPVSESFGGLARFDRISFDIGYQRRIIEHSKFVLRANLGLAMIGVRAFLGVGREF